MDITTFNNVLNSINYVLLGVIGFAFAFQLIYLFLFFLPARKYPEAKEKHYCGIVICAKDEEAVIGRTIKQIQNLNYPKDKYEIIVLADNCSDKTAEIARSLSGDVKVTVYERGEVEKKKRCVSYALNYLFEQLKPTLSKYDFFIRFDADDIVDPEYINEMNSLFEAGYAAGRGYNHASNLTQNVIAGVSGLWYIRDSRFNCQARSALHTDSFLLGGGMMFSRAAIEEDGGWVCLSQSEDVEFNIQCMKKKRKVGYAPKAIVYEDQPSTLKDIFRRNIRMGHSLHKLFWTKGWYCLFKFFTTFRYCWLDMFLNLFFIPIAVLCCTWLPIYYVYTVLFNLLNAAGDPQFAITVLWVIVYALAFAFIVPFILQAFLVYVLDRKKIGVSLKKLLPTILLFPLFMIIYAASIFLGTISKQQWKKAKRNVDYQDDVIKEIESKENKR